MKKQIEEDIKNNNDTLLKIEGDKEKIEKDIAELKNKDAKYESLAGM